MTGCCTTVGTLSVSSGSLGDWFLCHRSDAQLGPGFVGILLAQLLPDRRFKKRFDFLLQLPVELLFTRFDFLLQLAVELLDAVGDGPIDFRLQRPLQRWSHRADLGAHLRDRRHSPVEAGPVRGGFGASRLTGLSLSLCLSFWLLRPGNVLCFPMCSLYTTRFRC